MRFDLAPILSEISRYRALTDAESRALEATLTRPRTVYAKFPCGHDRSPRNTVSGGGAKTRCGRCNKAACKRRRAGAA